MFSLALAIVLWYENFSIVEDPSRGQIVVNAECRQINIKYPLNFLCPVLGYLHKNTANSLSYNSCDYQGILTLNFVKLNCLGYLYFVMAIYPDGMSTN